MFDALPRHTAPFFGRRRSLRRVQALLREQRLVTLTGAGGSGKTRLALRVAEEAVEGPDGVGWTELAPLGDPRLVATTICQALKLRPAADTAPRDVLVRELRSWTGLLVLDNCEHLLDACADIATELLDECPGVRILATSRQPLAAPAEVLWPVPTLAVPELDGPPEEVARRVAEAESVQFFVQRVRALRPDFELVPANAVAVGRLCRHLDGIPLALELAAARARVLSPGQIVEHLERGLDLLSRSGDRGPARHRTMVAALDWSHQLLDEAERALARRLAVFAGGASLEACSAICHGGAVRAADVLDLLGRLVDKSLVVVDEAEGAARYRMLEPVRQFALERLEASGERERVERRHAACFVDLAVQWVSDLLGPRRRSAIARFESDHDNLRRAWDHAVTTADWSAVAKLARALFWFWNFSGHFVEGRARADDALDRMSPAVGARLDLLWVSGTLAWMQGDYVAAQKRLEECETACRESGRDDLLPLALRELAGVRLTLGDLGAAARMYEEASAILEAAGRDWDRALALIMLADVRSAMGEPEAACRLLENARGLFAGEGDPWGRSLAHFILAVVTVRQGDPQAARSHAHEALALQRTAGDDWNSGQVLALLGEIEARDGDPERAESRLLESLEAFRRVGDRAAIAHVLRVLGKLDLKRGRTLRAVRLAAAGRALAEAAGAPYIYAIGTEADLREAADALERAAGEEAFLVESAAGRAMSMDEAIAFALDTPRREEGPGPLRAPAASVRVFGLGVPEVFRERRRLRSADWTYALPRELLYYLLLHGPRTKEQIGLDFWPEASTDQLRGRFRTALYHLRRALGGTEWVRYESGRYAFNRDLGHWFDVESFESKAEAAEHSLQHDPGHAASAFQEALDLYRGDFLEGESPGRWASAHRDRLRRRHLQGLLHLADLRDTEGAHELAADLFRRAIDREGLSAAAHLGLARSLARLGDRPGALRGLDAYEDLLRSALDADPSRETAELRSRIERGEDV